MFVNNVTVKRGKGIVMKRILSFVLCVLLLHVFCQTSLALDGAFEQSRKALLTTQVKAGIADLGAGTSTRVRVKLYDNTNYNGYITEVGEDYFVVADAKTGATAPIKYREVKGIKGNNLSTGAKIGIGVAIAAGIAIAIAIAAGHDKDRNDSPCTAQIRAPCPPGCVCIQ